MNRVQLWSCGGGRQSAGIAAMIVMGELPAPDHVCMAALEWEKRTTFDYVNAWIRPAMRKMGVPFSYVSRKKYATVGMWSGEGGESTVLPVFSDKNGQPAKLPEYCSGEWKRRVIQRWAAEQPGWKAAGVDCWLGISWDEKHRRRGQSSQWWRGVYPLLDMLPKLVGVEACLDAVQRVGWPTQPRSRCTHCPNQSDTEWAELTPAELADVCAMEDEVRKIDPHAYFHRSLKPLRMVEFKPETEGRNLFSGGCSAGMCY